MDQALDWPNSRRRFQRIELPLKKERPRPPLPYRHCRRRESFAPRRCRPAHQRRAFIGTAAAALTAASAGRELAAPTVVL